MINVRRADLFDLKSIQELNNQLFELELEKSDKYLTANWPLSEEGVEYFEEAIRNDYVIVATKENKVVGYLLAVEQSIPYYKFPVVELCNMCVDKNCRGAGIGNALFRVFERFYKDKGIDNFMVTASFLNDNARAFYEKMGFEVANVTYTKFNKTMIKK